MSNEDFEGGNPIAYATISGQIFECNELFSEICGISEKELQTLNLTSLVKFDDPNDLLECAYSLDLLSSGGSTKLNLWRAGLGRIKNRTKYGDMEILARISDKRKNGKQIIEATFKETKQSEARRSKKIVIEEHHITSCTDQLESLDEADVVFRKHRVLVVDDAALSLKMMARMITQQGHEVVTAEDGLEALKWMRSENFDIVIMDINMPNMNGLEASHEFRKIERNRDAEKMHPLKLVAMSGDISSSIFYEVTNAGFDAFVPKPLTLTKFNEIVRLHLKGTRRNYSESKK